jgi:hypothetical protein
MSFNQGTAAGMGRFDGRERRRPVGARSAVRPPPARHRPGARSARRDLRCFHPSAGRPESGALAVTSFARRHRPSLEVLEDRVTPSNPGALDAPVDRFQPGPAPTRVGQATVLHTFQTSFAAEVANTIPVSADKLLPLLPDEYELVPAAALGLGGSDQGIVAIANFRGDNPRVDHRTPRQDRQVAIDVLIRGCPGHTGSSAINMSRPRVPWPTRLRGRRCRRARTTSRSPSRTATRRPRRLPPWSSTRWPRE